MSHQQHSARLVAGAKLWNPTFVRFLLHPFQQDTRWHWQQVRYKRRDGDRYADRERNPSKKQLKKYNRKIQAAQTKQDKHSAPGSKAGPRREFAQALKETYLNSNNDENSDQDALDYDFNDALLDDLMGNTKDLSSQPTPEPVFLGDKHRKYFNHVADQMARYRKTVEQLQEGMSPDEVALIEATELPSDKALSLVVRSYRDRHGTRRNPVGIVKALRHVLQDLQVPISIFGEYTYTSLLSSCRTPAEGRRIFQMMKENKHPISSYSWSILVDLYAKVADFEGCATTMNEMVEVGGVAPTLPAFTSLLSACYKVCNDGRIPHSIRASAGEMAWKKWQEMRVVGISPDVMAYGAILRVCAARGHAERAINLLEEMQQMEVKPTTLCFSSALRAVARSHAIAVRYERGSSERHRRREFLTQHHGNMARSLVVMAENAEVEQDDGFVAALILCAASAGDMATAKAVYVASEIRRLDQLRTIGSDEHLARLRGENSPETISEQQQLLSPDGALPNDESTAVAAGGDESELSLVKTKGKSRQWRRTAARRPGDRHRVLRDVRLRCPPHERDGKSARQRYRSALPPIRGLRNRQRSRPQRVPRQQFDRRRVRFRRSRRPQGQHRRAELRDPRRRRPRRLRPGRHLVRPLRRRLRRCRLDADLLAVNRLDDFGFSQHQQVVIALQIAMPIRKLRPAIIRFGQFIALYHRAHRAV